MGLHDNFDRQERLFAHIYAIPVGTTVDAVTVAKNTWPDATPASNYSAYKLKEVSNMKKFKNTESESLIYVSETAAGWEQQDRSIRKNDGITFDTARTNALYKMLENGLTELPIPGTAYVPNARKSDDVECVFLIEIGDVDLGVITERRQTWGRIELASAGDMNNKTAIVGLKITYMDAGNNTFEMVDLP